jgi:hypothetical protein
MHRLTLGLSVCLLNSLSYSGIWDGQWMNKGLKCLLFVHIVVIDSLPIATSPAIPTTDLPLDTCDSAFGLRSLGAHYETDKATH